MEYQSMMQIVLECLFGWDDKNQQGNEGILGVLDAFCRADEEQGRGDLHSHWLLWISGMNKLRKMMLSRDKIVRQEAVETYLRYVNKVMSARYGEFDLVVTHTCANNKVITSTVSEIYNDEQPQVLRDARHKKKCHDIKGCVMKCKKCGETTSPSLAVTSALNVIKQQTKENVTLPLSKNMKNIVSLRTAYDMNRNNDSRQALGNFWGSKKVRDIVLHDKFDQHLYTHAKSCQKKGDECRFLFPFMTRTDNTRMYCDSSSKSVEHHCLDGSVSTECRFSLELNRPQACQYINTHNVTVSDVINCNNNIQTGDSGQTFYQTLYTAKNTTKDDAKPRDLVANQVCRRLRKAQAMARFGANGENCDTDADNKRKAWVEGLSLVLSGVRAASSRTVTSAPMAHNLVLQGGNRFFLSLFCRSAVGTTRRIVGGTQ